jgi:elongation of very long chain fatty acids protein 4
MEALQTYLRAQGKAFTLWANPQITASNYSSRSSANYPLIELDGMLAFTGFYFIIALWGIIKYYSSQSTTSSNQKSVSSTKSVTTKDNEKKSSDSWSLAKALAKLNAEPILWFVSFYNLAQVVICTYMCVEIILAVFSPTYHPGHKAKNLLPICLPHSITEPAVARVHWVFYVSKILDFLDTVFIIVRGKWDQFIFLHVYHHLSVFPVQWIISTAGMDGDAWWPVFANAFIHVIMYTYYGLTTLGIKVWWGRFLTIMQMTQFVSMIVHSGYLVIKGCPYPLVTTLVYHIYVVSLLVLFAQFYVKKHGFGGGSKSKAVKAE